MRRYLLEQAGLAAVPFEAFGFDGEAWWFRLSVGSVSERAIGEALVRLRGALERVNVEP
jgi:aspartate aminotransferase